LVASGKTVDEVLAEYPYLGREDILEAYRTPHGRPKKGKANVRSEKVKSKKENANQKALGLRLWLK
jgi:hypothetical protein